MNGILCKYYIIDIYKSTCICIYLEHVNKIDLLVGAVPK